MFPVKSDGHRSNMYASRSHVYIETLRTAHQAYVGYIDEWVKQQKRTKVAQSNPQDGIDFDYLETNKYKITAAITMTAVKPLIEGLVEYSDKVTGHVQELHRLTRRLVSLGLNNKELAEAVSRHNPEDAEVIKLLEIENEEAAELAVFLNTILSILDRDELVEATAKSIEEFFERGLDSLVTHLNYPSIVKGVYITREELHDWISQLQIIYIAGKIFLENRESLANVLSNHQAATSAATAAAAFSGE